MSNIDELEDSIWKLQMWFSQLTPLEKQIVKQTDEWKIEQYQLIQRGESKLSKKQREILTLLYEKVISKRIE